MYVVDHLMKLSGIYLEDAKQVLRLLCKYLSAEASKEYQLILLRKMGVPMTVLVRGEDEILLEDNAEIIACLHRKFDGIAFRCTILRITVLGVIIMMTDIRRQK